MNQPERPTLRIDGPVGLIAVVPHLLGFTPEASLVVVGTRPPTGRVQVALRYDLPDPPATSEAADIVVRAASVLPPPAGYRRSDRLRNRSAGHPARRRVP